jgi:nucleoside-diphosphate-sugar epimerase
MRENQPPAVATGRLGQRHPLRGKRLVITGASGQIAGAIAKRLAADNEVYGVARFRDERRRLELEDAGVACCPVDLTGDDLSRLPARIDHVLHLAAYIGPANDTSYSLEVNAVATGRLLAHYRDADSALVMSTCSVYRPHDDAWHRYAETDPLGDPVTPAGAAYGLTKVAQEAVAKFCAREFGLRVIIARMNVAYGPGGGMPAQHLDAILAETPIVLRNNPVPYSPIYEDDIADHTGALLSAATSPAEVVNFGGDAVVTAHEWCAYIAELVGHEMRIEVSPLPGSQPGMAADPRRRQAITGPDAVEWRDGMRRMVLARFRADRSARHPDVGG